MKKMKLFCLPYAGGSANVYLKWKTTLHPSIELIPLEPAGRGKRMADPLCTNVSAAVEDLYQRIEHKIDEAPYCIFGHSMGCLLTYELLHKIQSGKKTMPLAAFLSGKNPPQFQRKKIVHHLPEQDFIREVLTMGGTPKEILEHKELLELFLPILRADFQLVETYIHDEKREKLNCPLVILNGLQDEYTTVEEIELWKSYTNNQCEIQHFTGGHFFLNDCPEEITTLINNKVLAYMISGSHK